MKKKRFHVPRKEALTPAQRRKVKRGISLFIFHFLIFSISSFAQIKIDSVQTGIASYYGYGFDGRYCASGEIFHKDSLTAASKNIPFGTWLRVTNLSNDSVVIIKVNDRMPQYNPRLIDLSEGAAKKIDMIKAGTTMVKIEIIRDPHLPEEIIIPPQINSDSTKVVQQIDTVKTKK